MRPAFEHRRAVRLRRRRVFDRGGRMLDRSGRVLYRRRCVLDRGGSVLHRSGSVLHRSLYGLVNRRPAGAAVIDGTTTAGALDDRAVARRRRRLSSHMAIGTAAAVDDGALARRSRGSRLARGSGRAVLGGNSAAVDRPRPAVDGPGAAGDRSVCTTSERRTFLAEYLAVSPAAGTRGHGAPSDTAGSSAGCRAAHPRAATGSVAAQTGSARDGRRRRLRRCVAAERIAVTGQDGVAAFAADAQPGSARAAGTGLTADTDTPQRARNMWRGSPVHRGAFTSDQPRLTARSCAKRGISHCSPDVSRTSQPTGRSGTGLTARTATNGQAASCTKTCLACQTGLAAKTGLGAQWGLTAEATSVTAEATSVTAKTTSGLAPGATAQATASSPTGTNSRLTT